MSRLEIPITGKTLWRTGDVRLWAEIALWLKDGAGRWHKRPFRVDSGAEISTFPAHDAMRLGLPMPQQVSQGAVHVQTGLAFRSGILRLRIDGMDQTEYTISCLFLGDPNAPPALTPSAMQPRNLLQPFQLLDRLRFTLDKDPAGGLLHGAFVIEKK